MSSQSRPGSQRCRALLSGAAILLLSACDRPPNLITQAAGHAISARIRGNHSLETLPDQAVITGPMGTVTIERDRVRCNGGRWTSIPAGSPVSLEMARHRLRIHAGNVTITHATR